MVLNLNNFKEEINDKIKSTGDKSRVQLDQIKLLVEGVVSDHIIEKRQREAEERFSTDWVDELHIPASDHQDGRQYDEDEV